MENIKYWIWLSKLNICPENTKEYLQKYTIENLWSTKHIKEFFNKEDINKILSPQYKQNLQLHEEYIRKQEINLITISDESYPIKLKNIKNPPSVLYSIGNMSLLNEKQIAIVGARNCTDYGKNIATAFAYLLTKENIVVTSGLAKGVDKAAHEGALIINGKTIAVIGTGIDIVYPKENKELVRNIIDNNGLIISEFSLGTRPEKQNFPRRNRIISGLSDGVLVVEASKNSGSLITADYALEQGKEIYAVPRKYIK